MATRTHYLIKNQANGLVIGSNIQVADSFLSRFKGLLGKKSLAAGEGLLITNCRQIHMFLMFFPLDILFLDVNQVVVFVEKNIKPWTISKSVPNAVAVVELAAGTISSTQTHIGDKLSIKIGR